MEIVTADWLHDQSFLLKDKNGYTIPMSQPEGVNGADLLPLSLIGCASWDIVGILRKQRQELTGMEVSAESEREAQPPWRFQSIHIRYRLTGRKVDPEMVRKAIDLTENKYCSIFATLRDCMTITSEFSIQEA